MLLMKSVIENPCSKIAFLGIRDIYFCAEANMELCRFLQMSRCGLTGLDISRNAMEDRSMKEIARALVVNCSLTQLDLGGE